MIPIGDQTPHTKSEWMTVILAAILALSMTCGAGYVALRFVMWLAG